jgi:Mg2+ and Co2+ transporter CorA
LDAVEATREAVRRGRKIATAAALLGTIVEHVADAVDTYAEDLAGSLDDIEERILADEDSDERVALGHIRRATVRLHRQLAMSRSLINRIECISEPLSSLQLPTEKLGQRLEWLDSEVVALRDRAHLLQEETSLKIAEHTNRHVEVLTIVATVLLPATLVAGIFGMNVKGLPLTEDSYGFIWSMGILSGIRRRLLVVEALRHSGALVCPTKETWGKDGGRLWPEDIGWSRSPISPLLCRLEWSVERPSLKWCHGRNATCLNYHGIGNMPRRH